MRCKECGYQNDEQATSCIKCGTALEKTAPIVTPPVQESENEDSGAKTVKVSGEPEGTPTVKFSGDIPPASSEGAPTIRGKVVDMEAWDKPAETREKPAVTEKKHTYFTCTVCQYYPLQEPPSAANPCPNCGQGKEAKQNHSPGTQKLSDIKLGETEYRLILKDESSESSFDFEEGKSSVSRENLDEKNKSISGSKHALFSIQDGDLYLEDESSNGASFVQVKGKIKLENGMKIILGNKILEVKLEEK